MFSVTTSVHGMPAIEVTGAPAEVMSYLRSVMRANRLGDPAYELRSAAGAFLQGQDEYSGWMLIEFWNRDYEPFVEFLNAEVARLGGNTHTAENGPFNVRYPRPRR